MRNQKLEKHIGAREPKDIGVACDVNNGTGCPETLTPWIESEVTGSFKSSEQMVERLTAGSVKKSGFQSSIWSLIVVFGVWLRIGRPCQLLEYCPRGGEKWNFWQFWGLGKRLFELFKLRKDNCPSSVLAFHNICRCLDGGCVVGKTIEWTLS